MCRLKSLLITVFIFLAFAPGIALAGEVKAFVPEKPWQITINLNDFEPWDLLGAKTIFGGSTKNGITITIIVEKTKPGTKPDEIRKVYGYQTALNFGKKETIEEIDVNDIAIIAYKWAEPNIPNLNEQELDWAKNTVKNRWGYHGYVVKDDIAFDIHLSADMTKHAKKEMLDIIKSFQIKPSTESEECKKLYESLDENISSEEKEKLLRDFIKKYPTNPEAQFFMGEYYLKTKELKQAKSAYLQALANHKTQPFIHPTILFSCYDGAGMSCGMLGEYELSKKYLECGYKLAKNIDEPQVIFLSAYNLACLYAETNDVQNSIKYLTEAVELNPESKEEAKQDSSFTNIKEDQRFKNLIYK
ncbi:MAG: hypothetical protein ABSG99_08955 [Sedimentisphaerales bacterium]